MPNGVEGAAVDPRAGRSDEAFRPGQHLRGGAAGEGEEENALWRDSPLDQRGNAMDEGARLSGTGAGNDEQWRISECDGARLIRVERGEELLLIAGGNIPRARAVEARLVGHWG